MAVQGGITLPVGLDLKNVDNDVKKLANRFKETTQQIAIQSQKVDELKAKLAGLQSGSITATSAEVKKMQTEFDKTTSSIEKTKAEISSLYQQLDALQANAFVAPDTGEIVLTGKEQAQFDSINAKLDQLEPKLEANKQKSAELGESLRGATGAATQAEINKTSQELQKAETKLEGLKIQADETGDKIKTNMQSTAPVVGNVATAFDKMGAKLMGMAKRVFVFALMTKALRAMRSSIGGVLMQDEAFRQSLYQLQAALWTAFAPIAAYVIPALKTLIGWVTNVIVAIGKLIAALTGKSYTAMTKQGQSLYNNAKAYEKNAKSAGKATKATSKQTKEIKKQLAAFDELNILQEDKNEADSGGGGAAGGAGDGGGLSGAFKDLGSETQTLSANIAALEMAAGGCLLALGLILLGFGQIGWGIAAIIGGIGLLGHGAMQWTEQEIGTTISPTLSTIMAVAGGALVAIGLILLFLGQIGWGLGAIIAGIFVFSVREVGITPYDGAGIKTMLLRILNTASIYMICIGLLVLLIPGMLLTGLGLIIGGIGLLNYTSQQLGSDESTTAIKDLFIKNQEIFDGVGLALIVIGLFLCCAMHFLLGLGLIFDGAVLIYTAAKINKDDVINHVKDLINKNVALFETVGAALVAIGIVLLSTNLPLGIAVIAVGAGFMVTPVVLNWKAITTQVSQCLEDNKGLIIGVSAAMVVIGLILLFSGVGTALGLGLLAVGGVILGNELIANWDFIKDKIKDIWQGVKDYWNEHIKKYFTAKWWGDLAKTAVNGFLKWFFAGLNKLIKKVNSLGFDLPDVLGGGHVGFSIPTLTVPQLAQGAVIPPNKKFMAILGDQKSGTNVEAPLTTIEQAVENVIERMNISNGTNQTIILELDGREVGRTFGNVIQQENNRVGNNFVKTKLVFG